MTIEQNLERIANALEALVGMKVPAAPVIEPLKKTTKAPRPVEDAPAAGIAPTADPLAIGGAAPAEEAAKERQYTLEEVLETLRKFADKNGADEAKKVMIKFGADPKSPKSKDIKAENYGKLMKLIGV